MQIYNNEDKSSGSKYAKKGLKNIPQGIDVLCLSYSWKNVYISKNISKIFEIKLQNINWRTQLPGSSSIWAFKVFSNSASVTLEPTFIVSGHTSMPLISLIKVGCIRTG